MSNQIPRGSFALLQFLQNFRPSEAGVALSPADQRAIAQAVMRLEFVRGREARFVPAELQARVVPVDRFLVDQFIPLLLRGVVPENDDLPFRPGAPAPSRPEDPENVERPVEGKAVEKSAEGIRAESTHQIMVGILHSHLRQILNLSPFSPLISQPKESVIHEKEEQDSPLKNDKPSFLPTSLARDEKLSKEPLSQTKTLPEQVLKESVALNPNISRKEPVAPQSREGQPFQKQKSDSPVPQQGASPSFTPGKPGEEWVYRLLDIEAAARKMASLQTKTPSAAHSGQSIVIMSKLITQFSTLQYMAQFQSAAAPSSLAYQQMSNHVLAAARNRLDTYLDHLAKILEQKDPAAFQAHIENIIQRSGQEGRWLEVFIAFLSNQKGAPSLPQALVLKAASDAAEKAAKEQPFSNSSAKAGVAKGVEIPASKHPDTSTLLRKETAPPILTQQRQQAPALLLLQARSTPELLGMIGAHVIKNPLIPANVLLPYPVSLGLKERGLEVKASEKLSKDEKHPHGQKFMHLGGTNRLIMCLIPEGPVIVGDSFKEGREDERPHRIAQLPTFLLASTPVTNEQFASWLNEQMELKTIEMPLPGYIYDLEGRLIALTYEAAPMSQIELCVENGHLSFRPQKYREHHPVVHVSWLGAQTFCHSQGLSLPTEEQWERGGGMVPTAYGQPIQKLRYGCLSQELSYEWANYFLHYNQGLPPTNYTLPVGFFDGERVLTIGGKRIETKRAASPWGCFDMSGNVREWLDEDYDEEGLFKVTKGGSYADLPFDLRIAARLPASIETTDPYTGFRVAFSLPESI